MIQNPIITDKKEPACVKGVLCQKSSGVAKFINVSLGKDVMSFLLSVGMKTRTHLLLSTHYHLNLVCSTPYLPSVRG